MAQDGRGGLSTPKAQAEYLKSQAMEIRSGTVETFRRETGHEVVAADEAWEAVFGPGSVKGQSAKALHGKIYLLQDSRTAPCLRTGGRRGLGDRGKQQ